MRICTRKAKIWTVVLKKLMQLALGHLHWPIRLEKVINFTRCLLRRQISGYEISYSLSVCLGFHNPFSPNIYKNICPTALSIFCHDTGRKSLFKKGWFYIPKMAHTILKQVLGQARNQSFKFTSAFHLILTFNEEIRDRG